MSVLDRVGNVGIVPVVEIADARHAVPLAEALLAGGVATMEITFRTDAAAEAIRRVAAEVEGFIVGAGTLVTPANVSAAAGAGAAYGVSPGHRDDLSHAASDLDLPFVPGVVTPTEILAALACGHRRMKFFPAGQYGGIKTLRSFAAPFASQGVSFMPTGGITEATLADYASLAQVFAVGGTWIASRSAIESEDFSSITAAAKRARAILDTI